MKRVQCTRWISIGATVLAASACVLVGEESDRDVKLSETDDDALDPNGEVPEPAASSTATPSTSTPPQQTTTPTLPVPSVESDDDTGDDDSEPVGDDDNPPLSDDDGPLTDDDASEGDDDITADDDASDDDNPEGGDDDTSDDDASEGDDDTASDDDTLDDDNPEGDDDDASDDDADDDESDDDAPMTRDDVPMTDHCTLAALWDDAWAQWEDEVLLLVNEHRAAGASCGSRGSFNPTHPLEMDPILRCAARLHSLDMFERRFFDHTNPDDLDPFDRMRAAGFNGRAMGENIARGQRNPTDVMSSWMGSDGHCSNIMENNFTRIGVGYHPGSSGNTARYWTQKFGTPR